MAFENWGVRNLITSLLIIVFCAVSGPVSGQEDDELALFTPASFNNTNNDNDSERLTAEKNQEFVTFNPAYFLTRSSTKTVPLPDDKQIELTEIDLSISESGIASLTAKAAGYPQSEILFTWQNNIAAATINTGIELYRLSHIDSGIHTFEKLPHQYLPAGEPLIPPVINDDPSRSRQTLKTVAAATEENPTSIDVMVLYTPAAEEAMGGQIGTQNTIQLALDEANLGFSNSNVHVRFELVYAHKVDLEEKAFSFSDMLSLLTNKEDSQLDEIHQLRDYYGADVVSMIVDRPLLCGKTYQNQTPDLSFEPYAFSVIHYSCATGYYSFAHEIGHNLGSQHDTKNASQQGIFPHSYGYQDPSDRFRTIMAYNCSNSCLRINQWSNPNIWYENHGPTGFSSNRINSADNHLSLNQMAPIVASFHNRPINVDQTLKITFQPASAPAPLGFLVDSGLPIQQHENTLIYGWNKDYSLANIDSTVNSYATNAGTTYIRGSSENGEKATWQIRLPNGDYHVKLNLVGTANVMENQFVTIEDQQLDFSTEKTKQIKLEKSIKISDGLLTIEAGEAESGDLLISTVEITMLPLESDIVSIVHPAHSAYEYPHTVLLPFVVR